MQNLNPQFEPNSSKLVIIFYRSSLDLDLDLDVVRSRCYLDLNLDLD